MLSCPKDWGKYKASGFEFYSYYYFDDISIEKIPIDEISLGEDRVLCTFDLPDTLTAPEFFSSVLWSTSDTTQSIEITAPGVYWVEGGSEMCRWRDSIEIFVLDDQYLDLGEDQNICLDEFPYLISGPFHMDTYLWNTGDDEQNLTITEEGMYFLEAQHLCGVFHDTIEISVISPPPIDLGMDTILCDQPVFQWVLSAPPGYDTYLWSTAESGNSIEITTPGIYWVIATYECGIVSDSITIVNQPMFNLDLGFDTTFCRGDSLVISAGTGFEEYLWSTGETTQEVTISTYGSYVLSVSYACGVLADSIFIFEPPILDVSLPGDTLVRLGDYISIPANVIASSSSILQWLPETSLDCSQCLEPIAQPITTTIYQLIITDEFGCSASDEILIEVENMRRVYIPNAFSPNDDGVNDIFSVFGGPEVREILYLKIFDRWGEMVFSREGLKSNGSEGWDGTFNGQVMDGGVFAFLTEVKFIDGSHSKLSGEILLVK